MGKEWKILLEKALYMLQTAGICPDDWLFGGGTALMLYFQHRESKDIDIFLSDAQYLTLLTPRLNNVVLDMSSDYVESSNFLKLRFANGEIDFIIAPHLTRNYYVTKKILGEKVRVETPEEIVIKKLFYRAEILKVRDVVDVAVVFEKRRDILIECAHIVSPKLSVIERRWEKLKSVYDREANNLLMLGKSLMDSAPALFSSFIEAMKKRYVTR